MSQSVISESSGYYGGMMLGDRQGSDEGWGESWQRLALQIDLLQKAAPEGFVKTFL